VLDIYQVDAFAGRVFEGNPAAVVPLTTWPQDSLLQSIAAENNLAETAYIVACDGHWEIRWFTPTSEVALCGHATLASAHVVFKHLNWQADEITFETRESGTLRVSRCDGDRLAMSFPAISVAPDDALTEVSAALDRTPTSVWKGYYSEHQFDLLAVFDSMEDVAALNPDASLFSALGSRGIIATSAATEFDFVSRYFAPAFGIPEDPVTGSAHCLLAPFWGNRLDKNVLQARQISERSGILECRLVADRVELVGSAIDYMKGTLSVGLIPKDQFSIKKKP
jgi:PhzF family phenazine biosynthesis protein